MRAQRLAAEGWTAYAGGDHAAAVDLVHQAAELEQTFEKHPVTPGPILPARELEGDLLLALDRPGDALAAYEATLQREPNRARALHGAARAAAAAGRDDVARTHYTALAELLADADAEREDAAEARRYLRGE